MGIARHRGWLVLVVLLAGTAARAEPLPQALADALPAAVFRGTETVRWLGFALYDASLWVPPATAAGVLDYAQPFVLRLRYARTVSGKAIADVSRDEIARLNPALPSAQLAQWHARMLAAFPDVDAGVELAGLHVPGSGVRLFHNGQSLAELPGDDFSRAFFGIWFDARTRTASLRDRLLSGREATP